MTRHCNGSLLNLWQGGGCGGGGINAASVSVTLQWFFEYERCDGVWSEMCLPCQVGVNGASSGCLGQAYRQNCGLIVTQMPLPHTVADFWRLLYDYSSCAVVMLNEFDRNDKVGITRWWMSTLSCCFTQAGFSLASLAIMALSENCHIIVMLHQPYLPVTTLTSPHAGDIFVWVMSCPTYLM